ncbi:MAG: CCA tRNA nucleotidyltransferase [Bdellovibrionales bacterium]|nr:CCA tRNA nucleotidyltransferase [Bdellovibrionales bacterium]
MTLTIKRHLEKNSHWSEVKNVIQKISQNNFQVFIVGGAIREALLNRPIYEIDLSSSASPDEIMKLFPYAIDTFKKYGVITIPLKNKSSLEIVTLRKDSSLSDGRRPQFIEYSNLEEDSKRRDFTINALYYDLNQDKLIDLVKGLRDLKAKKIITIGKAKDRFKEDYLRILRALRLACQLNFDLDSSIKPAIFELRDNIKNISQERIKKELNKMFSHKPIKESLNYLKEYGLFELLFPELNFNQIKRILLNYQQSLLGPENIAFYWSILLSHLYGEEKKFSIFLKKYLSASQQKESLKYFKSVKILLDEKQSLGSKILAFNEKHQEVYELTQIVLNSKEMEESLKIEKKKTLPIYLKEFKKRITQGKLPPSLVTGKDLLKMKISIKKKNFSKALEKIYYFQLENLKMNKTQLLKKVPHILEIK